jgi:hypothetical protein
MIRNSRIWTDGISGHTHRGIPQSNNRKIVRLNTACKMAILESDERLGMRMWRSEKHDR